MDQALGSPFASREGRSPFTPRRNPKTPLPPSSLKKSSRFSVSGRSLQLAQVILKSQSYNVERFGNTLPVIITEALTFADRNSVVSVRISECGYAWLVCGRRLLVWQYRQNIIGAQSGVGTPQRKNISGATQCYELTLPQSDLAHRADLVSVFCMGGHIPSCIAVSPEGVVRYWPNVSHEGVSVEIMAELQGQECDSVTCVGKLGCILATTTCTVVLVQPKISSGGRHSLGCHTLRTPQGWLGAIGKRMSSLIFGPMASEHSNETRLVRVLSVKQSEEQYGVFVLAGQMLQKWYMSYGEPEHLIYVTELGRVIRDAFQCTAWESCGSDPADIDLWLLDIQVVGNSIMLLAAAVNLHVSPQVQYALVRMDANSIQNAAQVEEFLLLKLYGLYQEDNTAEFLSYRLLLCDTDIYIHRKRDITIIQSSNEPEVLDFTSVGDRLLGGSVCSNTPVFFSQNHGLVAVYSNDGTPNDLTKSFMDIGDLSMNDSKIGDVSMSMSVAGNLSLYNIEPEEVMTAHKDIVGQLKAAFIFFIKRDQQSYQEILSELFPETETELKNEVDNILDKAVIQISEELLNDAPAKDPRWKNDERINIGLGSSTSMQIQYQLQDKREAHELYLQFLQQTGLWQRFSAVTVENSIQVTLHILADHSELVVAAIGLKNLMTNHNTLLQEIIDQLYDRDVKRGLTKQDFFFKEVTNVHRLLSTLCKKNNEESKTNINPIHLINLITESNNIIMNILNNIMEYRQQKASLFSPKGHFKYTPWTFAPNYGVYEALETQKEVTLLHGARVTTEGSSRACLYDQYVNLVDILLDGRKCNVESSRNTHGFESLHRQYQAERSKLIQPLVDDKEWERAALLAEKYLDYNVLVMICENTNNQQRLDDYLERFKNDDFAQHVFNWYLQENKQGKLLAKCKASARRQTKSNLTQYLGTHPSLSWLQHIFEQNYDKASVTLNFLAMDEKKMLTKKKSLLSIAKLANLTAKGINNESNNNFVQNIDKQLDLIAYQEELPDSVLSAYGYDTIKPPVLEPETLSQLYISDENSDAAEYDYMKSLEIASFVTNEEQKFDLELKIWCSCINRNCWKYEDHLSPLEFVQNTLFYKLVNLAFTLGKRPADVLPPVEVLLDSNYLDDLRFDTNFQYLIKLSYDHFYRAQESEEMVM